MLKSMCIVFQRGPFANTIENDLQTNSRALNKTPIVEVNDTRNIHLKLNETAEIEIPISSENKLLSLSLYKNSGTKVDIV